jgi:hypothetical protein
MCIVTLESSGIEKPNVPLVEADQNDRPVTVSGSVPAQFVHSGSFDAATLPPLAEPQVTASRVVTDDTFAVPAAPGAPVCIWTSLAFVPTMSSSAESATVALGP